MSGVSVVIPALNEEEPIAGVVREVLATNISAEIIVVDNNSTDRTAERAREAGARVVPAERGYGRACAAGAAAARPESDIIVFLDGDGSDCPEFMNQIVDPIVAGTHDFVIGSRTRGTREARSMNFQQVVSGRMAGWILGLLYGVRYTDMCPFRAIRRDALDRLSMQEMTYGWNLEMQMKAARASLRILEIPVNHRRRAGGESKVSGTLRGTFIAGARIVMTLVRVALEKCRGVRRGERLISCSALVTSAATTRVEVMSRTQAIATGLLAGLVAAIAMTVVMLLLACFGIATPLVILGDRLSVFIPPGPFLQIMGKVGGYNHLKQLGVGSTIAGQLVVGATGGAIFGLFMRRNPGRHVMLWTMLVFVALPIMACAIVLWPVLGANYRGLPIDVARFVNLVGFAVAVFIFERTLVSSFHSLVRQETAPDIQDREFTPAIGRRAFVLGAIGVGLAGGGVALARKLWRVATFSYDGTQHKGPGVQPITPNDLFYCVTKNVVDPKVTLELWRLEVGGLVQNPATWRFIDLIGFEVHEQETTLMCISNGLDAGLISNARWKGLVLRDLIDQAAPLSNAARVRLHGVDDYTDTISLEKALDPNTLLAYEMNGVPLPDRHGYPLRVIVPGYFGEKHVKWLTRIELAPADAKGFYETQGWGPDFITPTRSRIDVPDNESTFALGKLNGPIEMKGMAYGGDRGVSRVELSFDDGETWADARITYPGTKLTWALWSYEWRPQEADDYTVVVRATDGEGEVQDVDWDRSYFSGVTGFHKIVAHVTA